MFGYLDTQFIDFAEGQSASRLADLKNRLGYTFADFIRALDGAVGSLNNANDPLIAALTYRSEEDTVSQDGANGKVMTRGAEYTAPRPQRGVGGGWLLPLYRSWIGLGFTRERLQTITPGQFQREVAQTVQAFQRGQRADVLERLFDSGEWPLDDDGNGASPGFAGSGSGTNAYGGPNPPGVSSGFTLYASTTSANLGSALKTFIGYLKTYAAGPFDLIGPESAIAAVTALPDFIAAGSPLIRPAQGTAEALVDANSYLGVYNGIVRVHMAEAQLSGANTLAIYKTYGPNDNRNPLAWRTSPIFGANAFVEDRTLFPLAEAILLQHYGLGVRNRVGAACLTIQASGSYTAPTVAR